MQEKPEIASVVGPAGDMHWGQTLHLPNAHGVVEVAGVGARDKGVHLLSELSRSLEKDPVSLHALQQIVDEVKARIVSLVLCVPVGRVLYVVLAGGGDVYLKRNNAFATLLHGSGAISGEVKAGDTILLASKTFSAHLTALECRQVFDHLNPQEVAEQMTLLLHEKQDGEGSTALILQIPGGESKKDVSDMPVVKDKRGMRSIFFSHKKLTSKLANLRSHPKKMTALITALLIAFFGISVMLGVIKESSRVKNQAVITAIADAQHALDEGVALMNLNPVKGREKLEEGKKRLEPFRDTVAPKSPEGRKLIMLYEEIAGNLTTALQLFEVTPELFFDVSLVKKEGKIASMSLSGTTMGLVDQITRSVYALDIGTKKVQVVGGGANYAGLSLIAAHGNKLYVLTEAGIHEARIADKKTAPSVVKKDEQWGVITSLVSFGGNLYLLDIAKSRIWKYVALETGFSETREYLNPDTLPDLSKAKNMNIDGSVWLGTSAGRVMKFTQGKDDTFLPKGVEPPFGSDLIVYTTDETKHMYVLDTKNKRVVVLDKDGFYLSQYTWKTEFSPIDLAVSEEKATMYLLGDGKLYTIRLK